MTSSSLQGEQQQQLLFGADFVSAITTSIQNDIPLFVGDEYTKETKQRLWQTLFDVETYGSQRLLRTLFPRNKRRRRSAITNSTVSTTTTGASRFVPPITTSSSSSSEPIDFVGTFLTDPMKLAPLALTLTPSVLIVFLTMMFHNWQQQLSTTDSSASIIIHDGISNMNNDIIASISTIASIIFSFLTTCKVFNTIIADRDDVLAMNARRAANVILGLKRGDTIRKRWMFTVGDNYTKKQHTKNATTATTMMETAEVKQTTGIREEEESRQAYDDSVPLFTLKTQLKKKSIRNLNLFEPRWLQMIDSLNVQKEQNQNEEKQKRFGCVTCTNKFYSAVRLPSLSSKEGEEKTETVEGRYADVIFRRKGTYANILKLEEGKRSVSGDRKVKVTIEGDEEFVIGTQKRKSTDDDNDSLGVSREGYLIAEKHAMKSSDEYDDHHEKGVSSGTEGREEDITIVVVVGLLHANGIIDRLDKDSSLGIG